MQKERAVRVRDLIIAAIAPGGLRDVLLNIIDDIAKDPPTQKIAMGVEVKDVITGFCGRVTAHCKYITGCDQYQVLPRGCASDLPEAKWFDEDRLEVVDAKPIRLPAKGVA